MKYEIEKNDLYYILTPKEEKIDSVLAPSLKADLITYEVEGAKNIIIDLKNVKFMDSSGLSAMLVGNRTFREKNSSFIIRLFLCLFFGHGSGNKPYIISKRSFLNLLINF